VSTSTSSLLRRPRMRSTVKPPISWPPSSPAPLGKRGIARKYDAQTTLRDAGFVGGPLVFQRPTQGSSCTSSAALPMRARAPTSEKSYEAFHLVCGAAETGRDGYFRIPLLASGILGLRGWRRRGGPAGRRSDAVVIGRAGVGERNRQRRVIKRRTGARAAPPV
jgi:hypothetical protein